MFTYAGCTNAFPTTLEVLQGSVPNQPSSAFPRYNVNASLLLAVLSYTIATTTTNSSDTITTLILRA